MTTPNVRVMLRANLEDIEVLGIDVFVPELILNLKENHRTVEDWYRESIEMEDFRDWIPSEVELYCEEYIIFECMGVYSIEGRRDYLVEYDETTDFAMVDWAIEVDDEDTEETP